MKRNWYKEYLLKREKEEIKECSSFLKLLYFFIEIVSRIFTILFYIGLIILCSIGATVIVNKIGIFKF